MRYVKIIVVFALIYIVYIGLSKFMDTSVDVAKKATDKASATVKLKALGLTDDEIESLTGS